MNDDVAAHEQAETHRYTIRFPEHEPRENDPHHADFEEYKRRRREDNTYVCDFATQHRNGDTSECDLTKPLECHHNHIEFALQNGVDIELLDHDFPGIAKQDVGAWIDGDQNLTLYCVFHHRGHGGVHVVSASDFEGEKYVRGLIS